MSFNMTNKPEILLTEISIVLRTDQLLSKRAFPEYANTISPFYLPAPVQGQICNYKHQVSKCLVPLLPNNNKLGNNDDASYHMVVTNR